jgi:hypothetical protein
MLCLGICTGEFHTSTSANWVIDQDPEFLIEVLWKVGFLRAQSVGDVRALKKAGTAYLGSYQVEYLHLRNVTRFQIHPMFRSYLEVKESLADPHRWDASAKDDLTKTG